MGVVTECVTTAPAVLSLGRKHMTFVEETTDEVISPRVKHLFTLVTDAVSDLCHCFKENKEASRFLCAFDLPCLSHT